MTKERGILIGFTIAGAVALALGLWGFVSGYELAGSIVSLVGVVALALGFRALKRRQ